MQPGGNVFLPCQGPIDDPIRLLKWSKPDLQSPDFVFYYKDERSYDSYQLESFRGRVFVEVSALKKGEASLMLRNVIFNDTGEYECVVGTAGSSREFTSRITLKVEDSGECEKLSCCFTDVLVEKL